MALLDTFRNQCMNNGFNNFIILWSEYIDGFLVWAGLGGTMAWDSKHT